MSARGKSSGWTYLFAWLALLAMTALSYGLSLVALGPLEGPVALTIALLKGAVVVLFFMHLIENEFTYRFVLLISLVFLAIMVTITTIDVVTRDDRHVRPPIAG